MSFEAEYFKERNFGLELKHQLEPKVWAAYFRLSIYHNNKILGYGCGFGQRVHTFREMGYDCEGFDISKFAADHACRRAVGHVYNQRPNKQYRFIFCVDVLEHLNDEEVDDAVSWMKEHSEISLFGITTKDMKAFPKDPTHINGKTMKEWMKMLHLYYHCVEAAPIYFYESTMYVICYD